MPWASLLLGAPTGACTVPCCPALAEASALADAAGALADAAAEAEDAGGPPPRRSLSQAVSHAGASNTKAVHAARTHGLGLNERLVL